MAAIDREKVIKGLKEIRDCESIVYEHRIEALEDAIALLKAQEPRVMTVADIVNEHITPDVIWVERRKQGDIHAGVWQIDHYEMADYGVMDDLGEEIAEMPDAYNRLWRCWTAIPTEAQRKETPWQSDIVRSAEENGMGLVLG